MQQLLLVVAISLTGLAAGASGQATPCGGNALLSIVGMQTRSNARRLTLLGMFAFGLLLGSLAMAVALIGLSTGLQAISPVVPRAMIVVAGLVSLFYVGSWILGRQLPVPTSLWIVPREWALGGSGGFAIKFGIVLGMGWITVVPFIGYYILILFILGSPTSMAFLGMGLFALGRLATTALSTISAAISSSAGYSLSSTGLTRGLGPFQRLLPPLRQGALLACAVHAIMSIA